MIRVLFEHHHLYYLPQFIPIIREMQKRAAYHIVASISEKADKQEIGVFKKAVKELGIDCLKADGENERRRIIREQAFDVLITGNKQYLTEIAAENTLVVMVYHGIGLKKSYYRDTSPRVDLRAVESKERYEILRRKGERGLVLCGFTKLDPLVKTDKTDRERRIADFGLSGDKKTVLYAPTFYPSSVEMLLPELTAIANHVNVLVKLHQFSWTKKKYRHHYRQAQAIADLHPHVYLIPPEQFNILPYYRITDILITDISSTLFEYLALNRPIIQTEFSRKRLKHRLFPWLLNHRLDLDRFERIDFTYRLSEPVLLEWCVEQILTKPDTMESARLRARDRFLYKLDGNASGRLVDAIEERIGIPGRA
ncbi:MAG: hypothetical protein GXO92_07650 [FCB group bacterium]|nr:hypothetical protein [FCB group bacterium]